MPHDVFIRHSKVMAAEGGCHDFTMTLQFNKWMTYIYITGKSGKVADDVYIRHRQRMC